MGPEVETESAREDSHPLIQPRHRIVIMVWMGILMHAKMTGPIVGQLGCLVPTIHLISLSIPDMTNDSIEEYVPRTVHGNDPRSQSLPPPILQLESVSMDNSLAPLSWLKRGMCLEIWCRRAGWKRHGNGCRLTRISGRCLTVIQARKSLARPSPAPKPCEDPGWQ